MGIGSNCTVRGEWIAAISLAAGAAAVGYLAYTRFLSKDKCCKAMVNLHIQKDNPKVVHAFDMEDLGEKAVYCRCWRSKKIFSPDPKVRIVAELAGFTRTKMQKFMKMPLFHKEFPQ